MTGKADLSPFERVTFSARDLVLSRGGRRIVSGVSLAVSPGDIVVLRGPNGVGKTTLLRALAGLLRPDRGEIAVLRDDSSPLDDPSSVSVFCSALNAHKAALTVNENLDFWAALYGAPVTRVAAARAQFGLDPYSHYPAGSLSTGLARRLGLARLIIANRPVWLIDEPTASLDGASSDTFAALIEAHRGRGGLAIIATHDPVPLDGVRNFELVVESKAA